MTWRTLGPRKIRKLYAVSGEGIGLLANTLAPTRREAISLFQISCPPGSFALDWSHAKNAGYRTVRACLEITDGKGSPRRRPIKPH